MFMFRIWIQVQILDQYGAMAKVNLTARVYEENVSQFSGAAEFWW